MVEARKFSWGIPEARVFAKTNIRRTMILSANDDMIVQLKPHDVGGFQNSAGACNVLVGRGGIAGRMVMGHDDGMGGADDSGAKYVFGLTNGAGAGTETDQGKAFNAEQAIQKKQHESFLFVIEPSAPTYFVSPEFVDVLRTAAVGRFHG